jgi:hypothetical protein
MADQVRAAIGRLNRRDVEVIRLRCGLDDRVHTLEDVGHQLRLTKVRIRQIEKRAEDKVRTLLREQGDLPATIPDEVVPASSPSPESDFSEDAQQVPMVSVLVVSQNTRTFIQNDPG